MSNIISKLGRGLEALGTFGGSEFRRVQALERQRIEQQRRQEINRVLSLQSIPAFARPGGAEPLSPQQLRQTQLQQLSAIKGPEATELLAKISPLTQKPVTPLSPVGKIQADITAGRITPQIGQQLIQRATAPRAPLVQIGGEARTEGEKVISKALGERVVKTTEAGDAAQDTLASAGVIQGAIDRGIAAGPLSNFGAFVIELGTQLGFPINKETISKATDVRVVNRELSKGALNKVEKMKGNLSNKDLKFVKEIAGRLDEGKATLQELVDSMVGSSRLATQVAEVAERGLIEGKKPREITADISKFKRENSVEDIVATIKAERLQKEQAARQQQQQQLQQNPQVQEAPKSGISLEEIQRFMQTRGIQ